MFEKEEKKKIGRHFDKEVMKNNDVGEKMLI